MGIIRKKNSPVKKEKTFHRHRKKYGAKEKNIPATKKKIFTQPTVASPEFLRFGLRSEENYRRRR